ncbi:MAG: hypothetical protein JRH15_23645 [Deltaproteobacteria bacterium]|nr:hypothetical protein [Deltaproteobacteria bacterium]
MTNAFEHNPNRQASDDQAKRDDFASRYGEAIKFSTTNLIGKVRNLSMQPTWLDNEDTFWFKHETALGHEYLLVDAASGNRKPAFDHQKLSEFLVSKGVDGTTLG